MKKDWFGFWAGENGLQNSTEITDVCAPCPRFSTKIKQECLSYTLNALLKTGQECRLFLA